MKQIAEISLCFIFLFGLQLLFNTWSPRSDKAKGSDTDKVYLAVLLDDCWNKEFVDDNDAEIKNQSKHSLIVEPPAVNYIVDIWSKPVNQSLLSPLVVDRPPPPYASELIML